MRRPAQTWSCPESQAPGGWEQPVATGCEVSGHSPWPRARARHRGGSASLPAEHVCPWQAGEQEPPSGWEMELTEVDHLEWMKGVTDGLEGPGEQECNCFPAPPGSVLPSSRFSLSKSLADVRSTWGSIVRDLGLCSRTATRHCALLRPQSWGHSQAAGDLECSEVRWVLVHTRPSLSAFGPWFLCS